MAEVVAQCLVAVASAVLEIELHEHAGCISDRAYVAHADALVSGPISLNTVGARDHP